MIKILSIAAIGLALQLITTMPSSTVDRVVLGPCVAGQQPETTTYTDRVEVFWDGLSLGSVSRSRSATVQKTCGVALLQEADLVYQGWFRFPVSPSLSSGGTALAYWKEHDSLLVTGSDGKTAEVTIPALTLSTVLSAGARAALKQPFTDLLQGKRNTIDGGSTGSNLIGGSLVVGQAIVQTAYIRYNNEPFQQRSHFVTGQNFSALGTTTGPFQVGRGMQDFEAGNTVQVGGFVSGYLAEIPQAYQAALGGTHLTGNCCLSIITRTSYGPDATVTTLGNLGTGTAPITESTLVLAYPANHHTLGNYQHGGGLGLFDGSQKFFGVVFPEGTRSVLFFGYGGTGTPCYGTGTTECPDPAYPNTRGLHAYPYTGLVYAYTVEDFMAVRQGLKKPWDVVPYATWRLALPMQSRIVNGQQVGRYQVWGAAYDAAGKRVFITTGETDGIAPLGHVWRLP